MRSCLGAGTGWHLNIFQARLRDPERRDGEPGSVSFDLVLRRQGRLHDNSKDQYACHLSKEELDIGMTSPSILTTTTKRQWRRGKIDKESTLPLFSWFPNFMCSACYEILKVRLGVHVELSLIATPCLFLGRRSRHVPKSIPGMTP